MSERKRGVWPLIAGWVGYWGALGAVTLSKPLALILQMSHQPEGTATASAGFTDNVLTATITSYGKTVWTGTSTPLALALWIAGPPLVMWIAWVYSRSRVGVSETSSAEQVNDVWSADATNRTGQSSRDTAGMRELPEPAMPFEADSSRSRQDKEYVRKSRDNNPEKS